MTDTTSAAADAAETDAHDLTPDRTLHTTPEGTPTDRAGSPEAHGMRPIALAFLAGNAAVLAVFALVVATGHLDLGTPAIGDVLLTTATAAPTAP